MILMRLLVAVLLTLLLQSPALAARLFTSGFETNNFTATEWSTVTTTGNGRNTIVTSPVHSGTYAYRSDVTSAAASSVAYVGRILGAQQTSGSMYTRFMFRWVTRPAAVDGKIFIAQNAAATSVYRIDHRGSTNGTAVLLLQNLVAATTATGTVALDTDTWYRIELDMVIADSPNGSLTARLYSGSSTTALETLTLSAQDTLSSGVQILRYGQASTSDDAWEYYIDDIAVTDDTGSFQTTQPGPGKTAMLVPAAEGATIQWTPLSGTDNALMVDDVPGAPDDSTTYNATSTAGNVDRLTLTNLPAEVPSDATIRLAHVYGRFGGDSTTGSPRARLKLWDDVGTLTDGPNLNDVDFNGWPGNLSTNELLVVDTAGKTKANLDSFEVGYEDVTDTAVEQRVTAVWVNVEWTEFVASACPKTLATLGVGC